MMELTRFASSRKTTSAPLRVIITHRDGKFPTAASIRKLEDHGPIVETRLAELPRRFRREAVSGMPMVISPHFPDTYS